MRTKPEHEAMIPVADARHLLGEDGKPIARQTVFALGARGEIDVHLIAGRYVVTSASIHAYQARLRAPRTERVAAAS